MGKIDPVDLLFILGLFGILGLVVVNAPLWAYVSIAGVLGVLGWVFQAIAFLTESTPQKPPVSESADEPVSKTVA